MRHNLRLQWKIDKNMVAVATKKKTSKKSSVKAGTKEKSKPASKVVKEKVSKKVKTKVKAPVEEFIAVGRRKSAIAKVRLSKGTGVWWMNGKEIDRTKLPDDIQACFLQPFRAIEEDETVFNVRVFTLGGGFMGQTQATVLGMARALEKMNHEWRLPLKKAGLLTRDSRIKERKKPGRPGARKRFQFSKR